MRMGDKKFFARRYQQTHPTAYGKSKVPHVNELTKAVQSLSISNVRDVKKDVNALFRVIEKKEERRKDHHKNQRWKRAQAGDEFVDAEDEPLPDSLGSAWFNQVSSTVYQSNNISIQTTDEDVIRISILDKQSNCELCRYVGCTMPVWTELVRWIDMTKGFEMAENSETYLDHLEETAKRFMKNEEIRLLQAANKSDDDPEMSLLHEKLKTFFRCPHCYENSKCRTCAEDTFVFGNHTWRIIEDLIIAMVSLFKNRNVLTFCLEVMRIFKTITGKCLMNLNIIKIISDTFQIVSKFCGKYIPSFETIDEFMHSIDSLTSFSWEMLKALNPRRYVQADVEKSMDDKPSFNILDAPKDDLGYEKMEGMKVSDWMETDVFKLFTRWFAYVLYMCVSRDKCGSLPFVGDLLKSMRKEGAKESESLITFLIKTIEYVSTKWKQYGEFGFMSTFYHSAGSYHDLVRRYEKANTDFLCKGNPEVHGLDLNQYQAELFELKKELKTMVQCGIKAQKAETMKMYARVVSMYNELYSNTVVMKDRQAPLCLLFYGGTGVGKTTLMNLTCKALCDFNDVKYDPMYIFNLNDDKRPDGFKTHMHTAIFDDVGNKHESRCPTGDMSYNNIISWVNNAAKITEQALAEDKGNVPVWCKHLLMTANHDMRNTKLFYNHPAAVCRRIHLYVFVDVKDEFKKNEMLDPSMVPSGFFDYYKVTLGKCVVTTGIDTQMRQGYKLQMEKEPITDINHFLRRVHDINKAHFEAESSRSQTLVELQNMKFDFSCGESIKLKTLGEMRYDNPKKKFHTDPLITVVDSEHFLIEPGSHVVMEPQGPWEYVKNSIYKASISAYANYAEYRASAAEQDYKEHLRLSHHYHKQVVDFSIKAKVARAGQKVFNSSDRLHTALVESMSVLFGEQDMIKYALSKLKLGLAALMIIWGGYTLGKNLPKLLVDKKRMTVQDFGKAISYYQCANCVLCADIASALADYKKTANYTLDWLEKQHFMYRHNEVTQENVAPQGGMMTTSSNSNFWVDNSNVLTNVDVGSGSLFYKDKSDLFLKIVAANTIILRCKTDHNTNFDIRALCLGGYTYVTNIHTIHKYKIIEALIVQDRVGVASSNYTITSDFMGGRYDRERDLYYFQLLSQKPKKSLRNLLYRGDMTDISLNGWYIFRQTDGSVSIRPVSQIRADTEKVLLDEPREVQVFTGRIDQPTTFGDCGAPMCIMTHYGPVIAGLHITGMDNSVSATRMSLQNVEHCGYSLYPDLAPLKMEYSSVCKTLIPERAKSHPSFLDENATLTRYGTIKDTYMKAKTHVQPTAMAPYIRDLGFEQLKGAPPMNHWRIFSNSLIPMTDKSVTIDINVLNECMEQLWSDIVETIPMSEFEQVRTLDLDENVNGVPGLDYINGINRATSMGFPFNKSKKNFITPISTPYHPDGIEFNQEVVDHYHRADYCARISVIIPGVSTASQKDEPLAWSKIYDYGTRLFFGGDTEHVLLTRKYYAGPVRLIQRNRHKLGIMVGIVAQSREWDQLANTFPWKDNMIAGDFSKFDKKQNVLVLQAAFEILIRICKRSGNYEPADINALEVIRADLVFALFNFDGDLISFLGCLASGVAVTAPINSLMVKLLMMYAYRMLNPKKEVLSFKDNVKLVEYGDDSTASVSPDCPWYNHVTIAGVMKTIGMKYTMAEKDAELVPYIPFDKTTFLKRSFVYSDDLKCYVGPLEESNLMSSLTVWVRSKNLTPEDQAYSTLQSNIREWWLHGRDKFEDMREVLADVYKKAYNRDISFPTYEDVLDSFESHAYIEPQCGFESVIPNELVLTDEFEFSPEKVDAEVSIEVRRTINDMPQITLYTEPMETINLFEYVLILTRLPPEVCKFVCSYMFARCRWCSSFEFFNKMCVNHTLLFSKLTVLRIEYMHNGFCSICGKWYMDCSASRGYICAYCLVQFYCFPCSRGLFCHNHMHILGRVGRSISDRIHREILRGIVTPAPADVYYGDKYKNYRRILSVLDMD